MFSSEDDIKAGFSTSQSFRLGEESAFDSLFRQYYSSLCLFANGYLKDEAASEDLVQECFIKLWEQHTTINKPEAIKSFLYTTVRNRCIDLLRKKKVKQSNEEKFSYLNNEWNKNELQEVVTVETMRQIYDAIDELPPKMQQVFKLYYIEGKKYAEIAKVMNTSYDTVRQQKERALKLVREKLPPLIIAILFFL